MMAKKRKGGRWIARCGAAVRDCDSLYLAVGTAKALVMGRCGLGIVSSIYDSETQVVVAVWTDDANGPCMHKLEWPQQIADKEWAAMLQPY